MLYEKINLEDDEKILKQVRKHWFILFSEIAGAFVAALFPLVIAYFFVGLTEGSGLAFSTDGLLKYFIYGYVAWLIMIWMVLGSMWTNYYLDIWTVSNKRLIAVDQRGLFHRVTGSFRLERLQDLNVEINGIVATLLDYGLIEAQTAGGSEEEFRASGLPHPRELKAIILGAADDRIKRYENSPIDETGV